VTENYIDRAWKDVLKGSLDDAISFFMPSLASERDYSKIPEAADPVHLAIGGKSDKGSNISDVCFKVPLKNGEFPRSLFFVEQQHEEDKSLPLRVFQSWYRASDEYQFPVTALVIYTGGAKPVNIYIREWHGTSVNFMFNIYSVPDEANAEELKRDERPFSIPVLAAKRMFEAKGDPLKRGKYSLELLDLIKKRGLDDNKARQFQKFTRNILQIDKEDIDPRIKEVWKVEFRPLDEVVREIDIRDAREEGIAISAEIIRALKEKVPIDEIAAQYNVPADKVEQFMSVLTL
jgi:hypothetical protein